MGEKEALEGLGLLHCGVYDVHDLVDDALAFDVVTTGPVIRGTGDLADDAAFIKELRHIATFDTGDDARLEVHEDGTGDVFAFADLVEEDFHVRVGGDIGTGLRCAGLGEAVLTQDETPEAVCDLIATLADMDAQDFSHGCSSSNWV